MKEELRSRLPPPFSLAVLPVSKHLPPAYTALMFDCAFWPSDNHLNDRRKSYCIHRKLPHVCTICMQVNTLSIVVRYISLICPLVRDTAVPPLRHSHSHDQLHLCCRENRWWQSRAGDHFDQREYTQWLSVKDLCQADGWQPA